MRLPRNRLLRAGLGLVLLVSLGGTFVGLSACTATGATGSIALGARGARLQKSPRYSDGRFHNPLPQVQGRVGRATLEFFRDRPAREPTTYPSFDPVDPARFETPPADGLRVTWLGHSTLLVELDGATVLVDPVWAERASPFTWAGPKRFFPPPLPLGDLPKVDAVVISHDHYDHLDYQTIQTLAETVGHFVVPLGIGAHLEYWGVDPSKIVELDWWEHAEVGGVTLTATPARHFSGRSIVMADRNETLWSGWALVGPTHRIWYSGDTALTPAFAEIGERLGPFDLCFVENGAYNKAWRDVHLGPEQAVVAHQLARGGLFVPVHWGTFALALHNWTEPVERLLVAARLAGVEVVVPKPGESVTLKSAGDWEKWWPEVPWETAAEASSMSSHLPQGLERRVRELEGQVPGGAAMPPAE